MEFSQLKMPGKMKKGKSKTTLPRVEESSDDLSYLKGKSKSPMAMTKGKGKYVWEPVVGKKGGA